MDHAAATGAPIRRGWMVTPGFLLTRVSSSGGRAGVRRVGQRSSPDSVSPRTPGSPPGPPGPARPARPRPWRRGTISAISRSAASAAAERLDVRVAGGDLASRHWRRKSTGFAVSRLKLRYAAAPPRRASPTGLGAGGESVADRPEHAASTLARGVARLGGPAVCPAASHAGQVGQASSMLMTSRSRTGSTAPITCWMSSSSSSGRRGRWHRPADVRQDWLPALRPRSRPDQPRESTNSTTAGTVRSGSTIRARHRAADRHLHDAGVGLDRGERELPRAPWRR